MELGVGRIGAILGPYDLGLLQQMMGESSAVMTIGGAVIVSALSISSLGIRHSTGSAIDSRTVP
jgi:hypothetical protein